MIDAWHPRAAPLTAGQWAELHQAYDAEAVGTPRLEQGGQLGIVDAAAQQRRSDVLGDMEVAEGYGVGVAQGT